MPASANHGIATSLPSSVPLATSAGKCWASAPLVYGLRSMKNWPRMPGHTTSTLNTSTSDDSALSSCWAAASLSVDDVVDVTTVALWPVFLDHASTPSLHTSNSLPTEPHEIEMPLSDFLQPRISTAAEHSKVRVFIADL